MYMNNKQPQHAPKTATPTLRFPEFETAPPWEVKPLGEVFTRVTSKNKINHQNILTISAEHGLVNQEKFFNKRIASENVQNYYLIKKGDFAYNKSYSKGYPMGVIRQLTRYDFGVVSSLYICLRINSNFCGDFYEYYFEAGLINNELAKIAKEGGRNHGLLNVGVNEFFESVQMVCPHPDEQQKIADCLTSLDNLITAHAEKLETLKRHKKGLMQALFPADGESLPRLRFPEFETAPPWEISKLNDKVSKVGSGITPRGGSDNYKIKGRHFIRSQNVGWGKLILDDVVFIDEKTHATFKATELQQNDVLLNITGASIGRSACASLEVSGGNVNQHVCIIRTIPKELCPFYLNQFIISKLGQKRIDDFQAGGNRQGLNFAQVRSMPIPMPQYKEQQKIADCLSSLDDLITAQTEKVAALKQYKKGLMQALFPILEEEEAG